MHCPQCQHPNKDTAKFCEECGAKLVNVCPQCGHQAPPAATFCAECGTALTGKAKSKRPKAKGKKKNQLLIPTPQSPAAYTPRYLAERILAEREALEARGAPDGERKTITALFADLKGSTALMADLDPEEARRLIDPALQLMMDAVHRYEGYVAQSLGDGVFALFGAPIAHEDHPQRALYAALRMQEEMRQYADRVRLQHGASLVLRVGLNTGEVVVRSIRKDDLHTDYIPVGHAINLAARMEQMAAPGSILITEYTRQLIEGYFDLNALGAAEIKGVEEPLTVCEVLGVGPLRTRLQVSARRGLTRFVGRQSEMDHLQRALDYAKQGHGQIVGVMGEPGVGKSRLFHEFVGAQRALPSHARDCLILETFSAPLGKAYPSLPLIDLLKNYFQFGPHDDERRRSEKITGRLLTLDRSLEDALPYLCFLLGVAEPTSPLQQMDPQSRRQRTLEAVKRLLIRESLNQPLIVIVEDLHWLDAETQAFLQLLSDSLPPARVLLLVNYRPEYQHAWNGKTYFSQLRLDPLGQEQAEEMLTALLGEHARSLHESSLQDLKRFILDKTEGNPFFMEEIVQALVEQGVLARGEVRAALQKQALADLRLPTTVQGVLAARIDRLPSDEKALLQILAVIGKEFSLSLLKHVADQPEDDLLHQLSHLQISEFIYERPVFPDIEYTFKHALTQEVAYSSVLQERRTALHERIAQATERLYSQTLDEHYNELAHHYSRSGNTLKAVNYLQRAGQQAAQHSLHEEAVTHFTTALGLLQSLSDAPERAQQELTLQLSLAASLQATRGPSAAEVAAAYTRALTLCQQGGTPQQFFSVLRGLWVLHHVQADLVAARTLGEQLLEMAERAQDAALVLEAHRALGSTFLWQGDFTLARTHLEAAIILCDQHQQQSLTSLYGGANPVVSCLCEIARVLWFLGYPEQALRRSQEALALARSLSDPFSLGFALVFAAGLHQLRREGFFAQSRAEESIMVAREYGFSSLLSAGTIRRGWALATQGQEEAGLRHMQQGLAARQATGAELAQPYFLALEAEVYGKLGQSERALSLLSKALTTMTTSGEYRLEAEFYRLKGELLLTQEIKNQNSKGKSQNFENTDPRPLMPDAPGEAEACFLKAIEIAKRQQARSLELRAVMSLVRLRQQQATQQESRVTQHEARTKLKEARAMLADVYNWFTEGFDTKDLQEAKTLLESLASSV